MDEFLTDKIESLECAIAVEEAIMAGLDADMQIWREKKSTEATPLQTRKAREWVSARGNKERFARELAHFRQLVDRLKSTESKAQVRDGQIVISIDIDALPLILSGSIAAGDLMSGYRYKVTDAAVFAKEVCASLNHENEIGTTEIHKAFDRAMMHAIDQGGEGVEEVDEAGFEAEAARLQEEARRG